MPFDPSKPVDHSPNSAAEMRGQLIGLKDLIDAIQSGIINVVIDSVTTGAPGDPAQVTATVIGDTLHLSLVLPQGIAGPTGATGGEGPPGPGVTGAVVDAVNTLPPGTDASASVFMTGTEAHFTFGIPRGDVGNTGATGEVTNAQLDTAIGGTSANSNGVSTLNLTVSDPPTRAEVQFIADKVDELTLALRRT